MDNINYYTIYDVGRLFGISYDAMDSVLEEISIEINKRTIEEDEVIWLITKMMKEGFYLKHSHNKYISSSLVKKAKENFV